MLFLPLDRRINDRIPYVIFSLVAAMVAITVHTHFGFDDERVMAIFRAWGAIPADLKPQAWLTHMFLHDGPAHVVGNAAFLILFGMNVERRLGSAVTLALYLASGFAALAVFLVFNRGFDAPLVGASGAVSGIVGIYLVLFRRRTVEVMWFAGFVGGIVRMPAIVVASFWFGLELLQAVLLNEKVVVAHWAHVGGFLGGFALTPLLLKVWRGYPEVVEAPPKPDLFEEKSYVPVGPPARRDRGLGVAAREWKPMTPAVRRIVDGVAPGSGAFATPARLASGLAAPQAEDLKSRLEQAGYPAEVVALRDELPEAPLVFLDRLERIAEGLAGFDALGARRVIESNRIARIQYATIRGTTPVLDVVIRDPWIRYRVSGATAAVPVDQAVAALNPFKPEDGGGMTFDSLPEMDEYFSWRLARTY